MATFGKREVYAAPSAARPVFGKRPAGAPLVIVKPAPAPKPVPQMKAVPPAAPPRPPEKPATPANASPAPKVAAPKPSRAKPQADKPQVHKQRVHTDSGFGQPVWGRRVAARVVDELGIWLLIYVIFQDSLMTSLNTYATVQPGSGAESSAVVALFGFGLIFVIAQSVYNIAMESSSYQATFGKMLAGVVVTDRYGGPPRLRSVILRNTLGRVVVNLMPFFSGYVSGLFNKERRCVHDVMAGTVVRRRLPREMATNYSQVFA